MHSRDEDILEDTNTIGGLTKRSQRARDYAGRMISARKSQQDLEEESSFRKNIFKGNSARPKSGNVFRGGDSQLIGDSGAKTDRAGGKKRHVLGPADLFGVSSDSENSSQRDGTRGISGISLQMPPSNGNQFESTFG